MDPRQRMLQLLKTRGSKVLKPAMKFMGAPFMIADSVLQAQPDFERNAYSRSTVDPKHRFDYRDPDEDDSYDMIAEHAMQRQAKLSEIARLVRNRGGTTKEIQSIWKNPNVSKAFELGKNPGDLLRGAGRYIPKQNGAIADPSLPKYNNARMRVNPGYNATGEIPNYSNQQKIMNWLAEHGLTDTR